MNSPSFFWPTGALRLLCGFVCLAFVSHVSVRAQDADLQLIKQQIVERLLNTPRAQNTRLTEAHPNTQGAESWMAALLPDGRWADIRYDDRTPGGWSAAAHLVRVLEMSKAYTSETDTLHGNPALLQAIHSALGLWLEKDYQSTNWWHNEIGVPMNMASILILLQPELSPDELQKGLQILSRAKIGMTGQNKVWLAGNVLMRALLQNDAALAQEARNVIDEEIVVSASEGLQVDESFHQHGPQLQLGNYGLAFAGDGVAWMETLRGTRMALGQEKTVLLRDYLLQGENTVVWNGMMDVSSCGRQLFPNTQASKARSVARLLASLAQDNDAFAPAYQKALRSYSGHTAPEDQLTGNKMFWRSDYMVDRRPAYYASVKMSSTRVIGTEVTNDENISGRYLGDGALYVYKTGKEYENIFPVWDWRKIPGVTCASAGPVRPSGNRNLGSFVGGVTDGHDGAAVLEYDRDGVKAKKSWFFFANRIVCLGTDITSQTDANVTTSFNQCLLKGPVIAGHDNQTDTVATGRQAYAALQWAWHDGTGYVFPRPVKATLGGAAQTGSWKENVYRSGSPEPVARDVFSLWVDHGAKPRDASYACVIIPSATTEQVQAYAKKPDAEILSNTARLQAVRCARTIAAVFYQAGKLDAAPDQRIAVDQPCLLTITKTPDGSKLTVADPTQKLDGLTVTWNGRPVKIQLPAGDKAGSGITSP